MLMLLLSAKNLPRQITGMKLLFSHSAWRAVVLLKPLAVLIASLCLKSKGNSVQNCWAEEARG